MIDKSGRKHNPNRTRIIELWNTTTWSASRVADEVGGGTSRSVVLGIIHRTQRSHPELIIRKTTHKPGRYAKKKHGRKTKVKSNWNTFTNAIPDDPPISERARALLLPEIDEAAHRASMPEAITGLKLGQCRWPMHEYARFKFCEGTAIEGSSYCACHWQASLKKHRRNYDEEN